MGQGPAAQDVHRRSPPPAGTSNGVCLLLLSPAPPIRWARLSLKLGSCSHFRSFPLSSCGVRRLLCIPSPFPEAVRSRPGHHTSGAALCGDSEVLPRLPASHLSTEGEPSAPRFPLRGPSASEAPALGCWDSGVRPAGGLGGRPGVQPCSALAVGGVADGQPLGGELLALPPRTQREEGGGAFRGASRPRQVRPGSGSSPAPRGAAPAPPPGRWRGCTIPVFPGAWGGGPGWGLGTPSSGRAAQSGGVGNPAGGVPWGVCRQKANLPAPGGELHPTDPFWGGDSPAPTGQPRARLKLASFLLPCSAQCTGVALASKNHTGPSCTVLQRIVYVSCYVFTPPESVLLPSPYV